MRISFDNLKVRGKAGLVAIFDTAEKTTWAFDLKGAIDDLLLKIKDGDVLTEFIAEPDGAGGYNLAIRTGSGSFSANIPAASGSADGIMTKEFVKMLLSLKVRDIQPASDSPGAFIVTYADGSTITIEATYDDAEVRQLIQNETNSRIHEDNALESRIDSIENLGHYAGAFDTFASLPTNVASFPNGISPNDFSTVRADETFNNVPTRYVVSAIDEIGCITWNFDLAYSTDISGKQDKLEPGNQYQVRLGDNSLTPDNSYFENTGYLRNNGALELTKSDPSFNAYIAIRDATHSTEQATVSFKNAYHAIEQASKQQRNSGENSEDASYSLKNAGMAINNGSIQMNSSGLDLEGSYQSMENAEMRIKSGSFRLINTTHKSYDSLQGTEFINLNDLQVDESHVIKYECHEGRYDEKDRCVIVAYCRHPNYSCPEMYWKTGCRDVGYGNYNPDWSGPWHKQMLASQSGTGSIVLDNGMTLDRSTFVRPSDVNISAVQSSSVTIGAGESILKFATSAITQNLVAWLQQIGSKINGIITALNGKQSALTFPLSTSNGGLGTTSGSRMNIEDRQIVTAQNLNIELNAKATVLHFEPTSNNAAYRIQSGGWNGRVIYCTNGSDYTLTLRQYNSTTTALTVPPWGMAIILFIGPNNQHMKLLG